MKKYLTLIAAVVFIFNGCKKTDTDTPAVIIPEISVQSISYPTFEKSNWNQVVGGNLVMEFGLKDDKDVIVSRIKDSVDIKSIATYTKKLDQGKYDINISVGNANAVADTFLRFTGEIKSYSVDSKKAVSLTAITTDGLITIGKSFIKNNTIPVFKADGDTKEYKLGLSNGFYYLYIKNGVKGSISFVAATSDQSVTKALSIAGLKQYNMEVTGSKASLQVVFAPFTYNQVSAGSAKLATLLLNPDVFANATAYFVATDETGKVIGDYKYLPGQTNVKFSASQPYDGARFNLYVIIIDNEANVLPDINCFMQIKRGATYTSPASISNDPNYGVLKPHFKNAGTFNGLFVSGYGGGFNITSPVDINQFAQFAYTNGNGNKLWVQLFKNQYTYKFLDIPPGTTNFDVDLNAITDIPRQKTITSPGDNLNVDVTAKFTTDRPEYGYNFGMYRSQSNQLTYYYPVESFPDYSTRIMYTLNDLNYSIIKNGSTIPESPDAYDAAFNFGIMGSTLANFKPAYSGTFDYYYANFISNSYQFNVFAPASANVTSWKFPDFSKYINKTINLSQQPVRSFGLYTYDGFDEASIPYKAHTADRYKDSKAVEHAWKP